MFELPFNLEQLEFVWPWAFIALLFPLLTWLLPPVSKLQGLSFPFVGRYLNFRDSVETKSVLSTLAVFGYIAIVCAGARPILVGETINIEKEGRQMMLVIDLSDSMSQTDMLLRNRTVSRLQVVQDVVSDFVLQREGDQVGLILFGTYPYLISPMTFDLSTVSAMVQDSATGIAGPSTAIGDAIGLAVKNLRDTQGERVVILLTDGANRTGSLKPVQAAGLAAREQIRIHTIGIGSGGAGMTPLGRQLLGDQLDEESLKEIASTTGGYFFRADDPAALQAAYNQLDAIEPISREQDERYRPNREIFYWPLTFATAICGLIGLIIWRRSS